MRRLAARYADELNLDGVSAEAAKESMVHIADACASGGRDPASLRVSVQVRPIDASDVVGVVHVLRAYSDAGLARCMVQVPDAQVSDESVIMLGEAFSRLQH